MSQCQKISIECLECSCRSDAIVWSSVNTAVDSSAKEQLLDGTLNYLVCPVCGCESEIGADILYHDMDRKTMVWLRYPDDDGKIALDPVAVKLVRGIMGKDYRLRIVESRRQLVEKIVIFDEGLDDRVMELLKTHIRMREPDVLNLASDMFVYTGRQDDGAGYLQFVFFNHDIKGFESITLPAHAYSDFFDILSASPVEWSNESEWLTVDYDYAAKLLVALTPSSPVSEESLGNKPDGTVVYTDSDGALREKFIDPRLLREFEKAGKMLPFSQEEDRRAACCTPRVDTAVNASGDNACAERLTAALFPSITTVLLDDETWRLMGFSGRPRRGRVFHRFVEPKRRALEVFYTRELAIVTYAQVARAVLSRYSRNVANQILARFLEFIVDGPNQNDELWRCYDFAARNDALSYLAEGIGCYLSAGDDFSVVVFRRSQSFLYSKKWQISFMLGCARMFTVFGMQTLSAATEAVLDQFPVRGDVVCARVRDPAFIRLVERLPG